MNKTLTPVKFAVDVRVGDVLSLPVGLYRVQRIDEIYLGNTIWRDERGEAVLPGRDFQMAPRANWRVIKFETVGLEDEGVYYVFRHPYEPLNVEPAWI